METKVAEEKTVEETNDAPQGETGEEANDEVPVNDETAEETPAAEETNDETPSDKEEEVVETKVAEEKTAEPMAKEHDIPKDVLKLLAIFPEMEFLYVGKGGGFWRNGTPKSIRGNAILYKNPYFKNNKTEK